MSISFPGESLEYRAARDRLLMQEAELRRVTEAVAAARRELPPGGIVPQDYVFQQAGPGGTPTKVKLSELFVPGKDTLVIYNFMFPRARRRAAMPALHFHARCIGRGRAAHHPARQFRGRRQ